MAYREMFSLGSRKEGAEEELSPEQEEVLRKVAAKVVRWKMSIPAILFLESVKPLNYIGSQMMVFFEPFVTTLFSWKEYVHFRIIMEQRENVERLLQKIEELDAEEKEKEKEAKERIRKKRKGLPLGKRVWSYITGN